MYSSTNMILTLQRKKDALLGSFLVFKSATLRYNLSAPPPIAFKRLRWFLSHTPSPPLRGNLRNTFRNVPCFQTRCSRVVFKYVSTEPSIASAYPFTNFTLLSAVSYKRDVGRHHLFYDIPFSSVIWYIWILCIVRMAVLSFKPPCFLLVHL